MLSFLLYHEIGPRPRPSANLDCFCTEERFRAQMRFLKDQAVPVLPAAETCALLSRSSTTGQHGVVLTFDDADTSFLQYALPVLQELDFPSAVFAVAGQLGQLAGWVKDPRNALPLMSGQQLRSLLAHRVELGSHSMSHRKLTELSEAQTITELRDSRSVLEDVLGRPVLSFAYPHGRYDARIMELAAAAGYIDAYSTDGTHSFAGLGFRLRVPRKYITCHDDLDAFTHRIGASVIETGATPRR
jgi:peptidoglycan/xylan/chitin deacetylase (PgdA/CDA1 family)